jgi:hypothetical protein
VVKGKINIESSLRRPDASKECSDVSFLAVDCESKGRFAIPAIQRIGWRNSKRGCATGRTIALVPRSQISFSFDESLTHGEMPFPAREVKGGVLPDATQNQPYIFNDCEGPLVLFASCVDVGLGPQENFSQVNMTFLGGVMKRGVLAKVTKKQ